MTTTARSTASLLVAAGIALSLGLSGCSAPAKDAAATIDESAIDATAAAALPKEFKDSGVIRVASDIPFAPMEFFDADNNVTGFDYDLAQAIGGKLGVTFKFEVQAFDTIIPSLQSNKHDLIMSGMNDTAERQKVLDFVDYLNAGFSILVPLGNPGGITGVLDLCGQDVAVQKATVQGEILRGYDDDCIAAGSTPMTLMELPLETDVQTAVRAKKAVADVVDAAVAAYAAQTAGDGKYFEVVLDPENPSGYEATYTGIGILKEDAKLTEAIRLALDAVIADGQYAAILKKYNMDNYGVDAAGVNRSER